MGKSGDKGPVLCFTGAFATARNSHHAQETGSNGLWIQGRVSREFAMKFAGNTKAHRATGAALRALALVGCSATALTVSAPAVAQDFTQVTAAGRVVKGDGSPIAGATVTVKSNDQGFSRDVVTDSAGSYRIPALPQGSYTFTITAKDFETFSDPAVDLRQSAAANNFQLVASSEAGGAIVVTGSRIKVADFDRTTTGAVIGIGELATRVPVARNLTAVVMLAPGVNAGDSAFGNLAAVAGSSVSENTFFLNGLNITDFRQGLGAVEVPFEFYDTIEVKNGGVPAEYGRFTGGFVNAITKSGSNEFHAKAMLSWEPDALRNDAPNSLIDQNDQDKQSSFQALVTLSGPILKDHLFFYAFYQHNDVSYGDTLLTSNPSTITPVGGTNPVTGQVVTQRTTYPPYSTGLRRENYAYTSPFYGGKIDFVPMDGQRFEFTYFNSSRNTTQTNFGITDQSGGAYDSRVDLGGPKVGAQTGVAIIQGGGENFVGRYTGQFTDWLTLSGAYGKNRRRSNTTVTNPNYPFISDTTGNGYTGNAVNIIQKAEDQREFYRGDVDLYFHLLGSHHIKAGYDQEKLTTDQQSYYTGGVAWTYFRGAPGDVYVQDPTKIYVTGRTFISGGLFNSTNEAFYVQDSWQLFDNRLTLNLGVRADKFTNDNVNGVTYYNSGYNFAPRLAFSVDPAGDGRTKVYGSFGRYFLPIPSNTNVRLAGAETDYTYYWYVTGVNADKTPILGAPVLGNPDFTTNCPGATAANCDLISDGIAQPTTALVSQNLKPQSVDEYILGIEHRFGSRMKVGLFGTYRSLNESLEDVAIDAAVNTYCTSKGITGCANIWTGFHQYVLSNPGADATITLSDPINGESSLRTINFTGAQLGYPKAKRVYKAVTATFDREFDGVWSVSASYTWSDLKGNIEGGIRSDNGQTDSGLTTAFDQPGLTNGAYGYLPGHARHNIKIYGSYAPTKWLTLGAQFQAISPRKFGCIGRVPVSVDQYAGAYGAAGFYCNTDSSGKVITDPLFAFTNGATSTTLKLTPRGSILSSDWNMFTNLSANVKLPVKTVDAFFRVEVFNVFNQHGATDLRELGTLTNGTPRGDYGTPVAFQTPRYFRFQIGVGF
jgi:hypothetical protein